MITKRDALVFAAATLANAPADFATFIAAQHQKWVEVSGAAPIKID